MKMGRTVVRSSSGNAISANIVTRPGQEPAISSNDPVEVENVDTSLAGVGQTVYAADFTDASNRGRFQRVTVEDDIVSAEGFRSWIAFPDFDFGYGVSEFNVIAANKGSWSSPIELRKLAPDGPLIGRIEITPTGDTTEIDAIKARMSDRLRNRDWRGFFAELRNLSKAKAAANNAPAVFKVFTTESLDRVSGVQDLYLVFPRGGIEISRFWFESGVGGIGSATLEVLEDAFIRGGDSGDDNQGSNTRLAVKNTGSVSFDRMSYMKFDLDSIPATGLLTADLYFNGRRAEGSNLIPVSVYSILNDNWTEDTITWNNESSHAPDDTQVIAEGSVLQGIVLMDSENAIRQVDVTQAVESNLIDGKLSLALADESGGNAQTFIDSRESTGVPASIHVLYNYVPSEVGTLINAAAYDAESHPDDRSRILPVGDYLGFVRGGTWIKFNGFNFGSETTTVTLSANSRSAPAGKVEFRIGSPEGELLATVDIEPNRGGWNSFQPYTTELLFTPEGQQDLYLVFVSNSQRSYKIDTFVFE